MFLTSVGTVHHNVNKNFIQRQLTRVIRSCHGGGGGVWSGLRNHVYTFTVNASLLLLVWATKLRFVETVVTGAAVLGLTRSAHLAPHASLPRAGGHRGHCGWGGGAGGGRGHLLVLPLPASAAATPATTTPAPSAPPSCTGWMTG